MTINITTNSDTGILYVVATPIGNLDDISARALEVLKQVSLIAAEDTRHTQRLLHYYGIHTPLYAYHDYNELERTEILITKLKENQSIALVSDAGTPLISDPGYRLVKAAHEAGIKIVPLPGPCAAITALSAAGLPTNQFIFEGFLPAKSAERRSFLSALVQETRTMIFYESTHRIQESLNDLNTIFGQQREAVIARELTKTYETIHKATLEELTRWIASDPHQEKGEFVIIVAGASTKDAQTENVMLAKKILAILLTDLPVKQAVKFTADITGIGKNLIYDWAINQKEN